MTVPAVEEKSVRAAEQTSDSGCPSAMLRVMRHHFRLAEHPYMAAWRVGALSRSDLQIYATEHDHIVVARASLAHRVAQLARELYTDPPGVTTAESNADVERWRDFSIAAGWCHSSQWYYGADPIEQTIACVRQVVGLRRDSLGQRLARLYAIVTAQHDAAASQLTALQDHYAMDASATAWFASRAGDDDVIRLLEGAIDRQALVDDPFAITAYARATYQSLWSFHDGVWTDGVPGGRLT
jgi:pyrroloquinoline quinone (PQQ) biosynthesis protein C